MALRHSLARLQVSNQKIVHTCLLQLKNSDQKHCDSILYQQPCNRNAYHLIGLREGWMV